MPVDVKVPSVGESITEGTLARWLKPDGSAVRADDPLFELETEKATTTVPAPAAGTLRVTVAEGETIAIGAVVGRIEEGAAPSPPRAEAPRPGEPPKRREPDRTPAPAPREPAVVMPAARRLAEESGVNIAQVQGTGRDGRVTKEDVQTHVERRTAEAPPPAPPPAAAATPAATPTPARGETRQRLSPIRQRIATRLVESQQNTATLTTFNEADLSAVTALRTQYKERFKEKHGANLGLSSFFVKAVVEALKAYPVIHSRIEGSDLVTPNSYDIGVAVSTERGLMVPILRGADRLTFAQIEQAIAELAKKAREGRITVQDLQGGSFTITNGGIFGSLLSTPILNPPQSAILGLHAIQKRPVAVGDQVVVRPMMYTALSYDHRLIDGREAVLFLVRVKECIEAPERLFLEI